jgi:SulP family sulfate permease
MADLTTVEAATADASDEERLGPATGVGRAGPPGVEAYRVSGPLFFGAADKLGEVLSAIADPPRVFVLRLGAAPVLDATGLHALRDFQKRCRRRGTALILCGLRRQPLAVIRRAGCLDEFDAWTEEDDLAAALAAVENSPALKGARRR